MKVQSGYRTNASDQGRIKGPKPTALQTRQPEERLHQPGRSAFFYVHSLVDMPRNMPFAISPTLRQHHMGWQLPGCLYLKGGQTSLATDLVPSLLRAFAPTPKGTLPYVSGLSCMKQSCLTCKSVQNCFSIIS